VDRAFASQQPPQSRIHRRLERDAHALGLVGGAAAAEEALPHDPSAGADGQLARHLEHELDSRPDREWARRADEDAAFRLVDDEIAAQLLARAVLHRQRRGKARRGAPLAPIRHRVPEVPGAKRRGRVSPYGGFATPASVMMPWMKRAGVTSNAGFLAP